MCIGRGVTMEASILESCTMSLSCDESLGDSTASVPNRPRANIIDIMNQGQKLRHELQAIRSEFLAFLGNNPGQHPTQERKEWSNLHEIPRDTIYQPKSVECSSSDLKFNTVCNETGFNLKENARVSAPHQDSNGNDFEQTHVIYMSYNLKPDKSHVHPTDSINDSGVTDKDTSESLRCRLLSGACESVFNPVGLPDYVDTKSAHSYQCQSNLGNTSRYFKSLALVKPREEPKAMAVQVDRKKRKQSRRRSLQKLLTPMRRRSGSLERATNVAKSTLSNIANGCLFINNQDKSQIRSLADGSDSKLINVTSELNSVKVLNRSTELSSALRCKASINTDSEDKTNDHPDFTKAIKTVACDFITPLEISQGCDSAHAHNKAKPRAVNIINASDLLDSDSISMNTLDIDSAIPNKVSTSDIMSISEGNNIESTIQCQRKLNTFVVKDNCPSNISRIAAPNVTMMTLREQVSRDGLENPHILHSTFNYPLHSTMNNPLHCTIKGMSKSIGGEGFNLSLDESSLNNTTSDYDSFTMSVDVNTRTLTGKQCERLPAKSCAVCKITHMPRQVATPKIPLAHRGEPDGLSQTNIDSTARLLLGRLTPIGASQSMLDSDKAVKASLRSVQHTTKGTEPNGPAGIRKPRRLSTKYDSCQNIAGTINQKSNKRKTKSNSKSSRSYAENKENINCFDKTLKYKRKSNCFKMKAMNEFQFEDSSTDFKNSPYRTASGSYVTSSQKRELKQKFKSFNSTVNSSQQTTLAMF